MCGAACAVYTFPALHGASKTTAGRRSPLTVSSQHTVAVRAEGPGNSTATTGGPLVIWSQLGPPPCCAKAFLMRGQFWYESDTVKETATAESQSLDASVSARATTRVSYAPLCTVAGLVLAQLPSFLHGPIPYKFDIHALDGHVAVRGWYIARMLIGFLVGITRWPSRWWIRGPLCGLVMMVPLGFVSLATPECGPACMFWNSFTGAAIGLLVGAAAFWVTGRHRGP